MKNYLMIIIVTLSQIPIFAQDKARTILGQIKNDSLSVEAIHVFNKDTKIGSTTNKEGYFSIEAKKGDTIVCTGIQFFSEVMVLTEKHFTTMVLEIYMSQKTNALNEVFIGNKLSGNLALDLNSVPLEAVKVDPKQIDFSNFKLSKAKITVIDEDKRRHTSSNDQIGFFEGGSGNVLSIVGFIINPIQREIRKSKADKRRIENKIIQRKKAIKVAPDKIRAYYGDTFFIENLQIPKTDINIFIEYCIQYNIDVLFVDKKELKLVEVFLEASVTFRKEHSLK